MNWAQGLLDNEEIFPSEMGACLDSCSGLHTGRVHTMPKCEIRRGRMRVRTVRIREGLTLIRVVYVRETVPKEFPRYDWATVPTTVPGLRPPIQ